MFQICKLIAIDFHSTFPPYFGSQLVNWLVANIFQNIFFCVQQKKETHPVATWAGLNNDQIFILGYSIPLNLYECLFQAFKWDHRPGLQTVMVLQNWDYYRNPQHKQCKWPQAPPVIGTTGPHTVYCIRPPWNPILGVEGVRESPSVKITGTGVPNHGGLRSSTFTFMHLADAFIQSDLHCIQVTVLHLTSFCFPWETNPWSWRC